MISLDKIDHASWMVVEQVALLANRVTLLPKVAAAIVRATTQEVLLVNANESGNKWRLPTTDLLPDLPALVSLETLLEQLGIAHENVTQVNGLTKVEDPIMSGTIPSDPEKRAILYLPFLVKVNHDKAVTLAGTEWKKSEWRELGAASPMFNRRHNEVEGLVLDRVVGHNG